MALREARENAGLSQVQLAKESGINLQMIRFYETGVKDINGAKLVTLLTLCDVLGCRLADVVTDEKALELLKKTEG